jgi:hypothetical protein
MRGGIDHEVQESVGDPESARDAFGPAIDGPAVSPNTFPEYRSGAGGLINEDQH